MHISNYAGTTISGSSDETRQQYALSFLAAMHQHLHSDASKRRLERLVSGIAEKVLGSCQDRKKNTELNEELLTKDWRALEMLLARFGGILSCDEEDFIQVRSSCICVPREFHRLGFS